MAVCRRRMPYSRKGETVRARKPKRGWVTVHGGWGYRLQSAMHIPMVADIRGELCQQKSLRRTVSPDIWLV